MEDEDHLFAFFQHGINSQTLKLPPGFLKEGVDQVSVRSSRCAREECEKQVEIYRYSEDHVYFNKGWDKFVKKYRFEDNDFMVLKYDGETCFSVRIFQKNGLEKVFDPNPHTFITPTNIINLEEDEGETSNSKRSRKTRRNESTPQHSTPVKTSRERNETEYNIMMEKSNSFSSHNAFFWRLIKEYNVKLYYLMTLPKQIVKNMFKKKTTEEVLLKNSEGRCWQVMVNRTPMGQYFFKCRDWKRFVVDNNIKTGDVCIFELVGGGGGQDSSALQVHVF